MINLDVVNSKEQHFIVRADEPMRVEIIVDRGKVHAMVYRGKDDDINQEVLGVFDGTLTTDNHSWTEK